MMICNADFEELFPDLFARKANGGSSARHDAPSKTCVARWEDDGGRTSLAFNSRRVEKQQVARVGSNRPAPIIAGPGLWMTHPMMLMNAMWVMLSGAGHMTRS